PGLSTSIHAARRRGVLHRRRRDRHTETVEDRRRRRNHGAQGGSTLKGTIVKISAVALAGIALAFPAFAQQAPRPLPERPDVVSWKTFAQVQMTRTRERVVPEFSPSVTSLDQKEVKVQGFMLPLDMGEKHALFILSAVPPTC